MLSWIEERIHLQKALTRPAIPKKFFWGPFFGYFSVVLLVWQFATGFCRVPYVYGKHAHPVFLHNAHQWGAYFLLVFAALYFLRYLYAGAYRRSHELEWFTTLLLGGLIFSTFATGAALLSNPNAQTISRLTGVRWSAAALFTLHVSVLPLLVLAFLVLYWWLQTRSPAKK